jgi:hypothetical protein
VKIQDHQEFRFHCERIVLFNLSNIADNQSKNILCRMKEQWLSFDAIYQK